MGLCSPYYPLIEGCRLLPQEQDFRQDHIPARQLVAPGHFPTAGWQGPHITTIARDLLNPHVILAFQPVAHMRLIKAFFMTEP